MSEYCFSPQRKNAVVLLFATLLLSLFVVGCQSRDAPSATQTDAKAAPEAKQTFQWKMVTAWPKNFPGLGTSAERFAEMVERMSAGRLKVKVFGANQLVPALEVFDAVSSGTAEMGHAAAYYWKGKVPAAQFFTAVPFGFNAQEMNSWLFYGGGMELWRKAYAPFNLVPMAVGNTGAQMAGWFNKEINSVEDLKGLKMRLPGVGGEVLNRAGGTAVNVPGGELFTSLQSGVLDASEWVGPYNDLAFGLHQAAKFYYYPGWHEPTATAELIINKQAWEQLPDDLQAIVEAAARWANQDMLDEYTARNNQALRELLDVHNVQVRQLPDDVLKKLREISEQVIVEVADSDPLAREVYESFKAFSASVKPYYRISEQAYNNARDL